MNDQGVTYHHSAMTIINIERMHQGRIQDFHFRGGGAQRLCASTDITSAEPNSLLAGVQGPIKGPGSSGVVLMVSRAILALFLNILIKNCITKIIVDPIFFWGGGARLLRPPPLGCATVHCIKPALRSSLHTATHIGVP